MRSLYSISIAAYALFIKIAALFGNKKAKLWVEGRKAWEDQFLNFNPEKKEVTWIHAASLGEFEQARPLIEELKKSNKNCFILLSFFSPSGYEVRKDYELADLVIYLPIDLSSNATTFLHLTEIKRAIFIKYEFWFNYLRALNANNIPTYLVSGIFRPGQHFFKFYGRWFRKQLVAFTHFFLQNQESQTLLTSIGYPNSSVVGDTRLDRVLTISRDHFNDARFESFSRSKKVIVWGSSWDEEHKYAKKLMSVESNFKLIIAPHELNRDKINALQLEFGENTKCLSETQLNDDLSNIDVLIVDKMGLLSKIYRYAYLAFIGGGFGVGIHNLLEASVYGCPVVFGPNYKKAQEAKDLIQLEAGFSVTSFWEFQTIVTHFLKDEEAYEKSKNNALEYILQNKGASEKILKLIER